jgi:cation:H+ antiporter
MLDVFLVLVGLLTLFGGGEFLVKGASSAATAWGMSRLLVGLTIVAIGTSAPEMAISIDAVFSDKSEIAFGNIVGSNISNVLLILGLTALVVPIAVHRAVALREIPIMIGVSLLFFLLSFDGHLGRIDGLVLILTMIAFLYHQFASMRKVRKLMAQKVDEEINIDLCEIPEIENKGSKQEDVKPSLAIQSLKNIVLIFFGAALLWVGSNWLVDGASGIASALGVSELVIGLTIVAIGSSSPEIVTSLIAALRGQPEMAIGNVLGSNISNLALVGGTMVTLSHGMVVPTQSIQFDMPIMLATAFACLPICLTGNLIDRWEGTMFLACYVCYIGFLFAKSYLTDFPGTDRLSVPIVITLVVFTLLAMLSRSRRRRVVAKQETVESDV